jgi:hypothetical protein
MSFRKSSSSGMEERHRTISRCKFYQKKLYKHNQFIQRNREKYVFMPQNFIWRSNIIFPLWRRDSWMWMYLKIPSIIQLIHRVFNNAVPIGRDYTMFNTMQEWSCRGFRSDHSQTLLPWSDPAVSWLPLVLRMSYIRIICNHLNLPY